MKKMILFMLNLTFLFTGCIESRYAADTRDLEKQKSKAIAESRECRVEGMRDKSIVSFKLTDCFNNEGFRLRIFVDEVESEKSIAGIALNSGMPEYEVNDEAELTATFGADNRKVIVR